MPNPLGLITLLTDFGDRDWFVASMKGVILSINPHASVVDLSHQIPSHAVEDGAYVLGSCYKYFPEGTVHIAVVDPGVGSSRRPIVVRSSRYYFVAPDNQLLTYVFDQEEQVEVREIENRQYRLDSEGRTFDGRDVFAPAAAWLTKSRPFSSFGRVVGERQTFRISVPRWEKRALIGEVVYVDRFGNLITNLMLSHVEEVRRVTGRQQPVITIAGQSVDGLVGSYSEGLENVPRALINSDGRLEIFHKESSASNRLRISRHEIVTLS
ncbi:SAM hydrolase/SAM-dependent halogenase family protein [Petrachloros mirabilis]